MLSMTSDQDYYLYPEPMDMRKGIDSLTEIISVYHLHEEYLASLKK